MYLYKEVLQKPISTCAGVLLISVLIIAVFCSLGMHFHELEGLEVVWEIDVFFMATLGQSQIPETFLAEGNRNVVGPRFEHSGG